MRRYLGIDVGTSSLKVVEIDETGEAVGATSASYEMAVPRAGWCEIDPLRWWTALCGATTRMACSGDLSDISGVCVTGQMHTVVLVDGAGEPVCDSISWNDTRTVSEVRPAREAMERCGEAHISKIVSTGSPALNLAWIQKNRREDFDRGETFVGVADWIAFKLGGDIGTDWCGASTSSLFDISKCDWSQEACGYFGIPKRILPTIRDSSTIIGEVSEAAAGETRIPAGTPIVCGTGDNPASALSADGMENDAPVISIGTSGVLMCPKEGVYLPRLGKPVLYRSGGSFKTIVQLSMSACGSDMEWWERRVLKKDSFDLEDVAVERLSYDMRDLLFYPHLNGMKTPHLNPRLRGAFFGIDQQVSRSEMTRAVMEGIAFGLRELMECSDCLDSHGHVHLMGGGAGSALWSSIICNVLGLPTKRMVNASAGHGAALLALSAVSGRPLGPAPGHAPGESEMLVPFPEARALYDRKYEYYSKIYSALCSIYGAPDL